MISRQTFRRDGARDGVYRPLPQTRPHTPALSETPLGTQRPTAYLDSMRGLAALCVVAEHFAAPFQPTLYYAFGGIEQRHFMQLPVIRLCYSGDAMVCIFFVISGVALSLKPARQIKERDRDGLYGGLGSSIFRRGVRLFGPALVGSFSMMLGTQLHFHDVQSDVKFEGPLALKVYFWERQSKYIPGFWYQFSDWAGFVTRSVLIPNTWRGSGTGKFNLVGLDQMEYGSQYWTIAVEYWSSILLFTTIIGTARLRRRFRLSMLALLTCVSFWLDRWDFGLFLYGLFVADMCDLGAKAAGRNTRCYTIEVFWVLLFCIGLFLASVPEQGFKTTPTFIWLWKINGSTKIWQSIGAAQIVTAVGNAAILQRMFSGRCLVYLGQISYALYIVHMAVLSTVGWRLVPMIWGATGRDTRWRDNLGFTLAFLLLLPVLVLTADIFYRLVDRPCTHFARRLEDYMTGPDKAGSETLEEEDSSVQERADV